MQDDPHPPSIFKRLFDHRPKAEEEPVSDDQKEMINNIFDFEDTPVSEIMTHRVDIVAAQRDSDVLALVRLAIDEGVSRIPVYDEDIDDITGVVFVKDFLRLIGQDASTFALQEFIRPVLYVSESTKCNKLFRRFTAEKAQMAVIIDEFGGTSGLVTMEDLLESIVGSIQDEYDDEEELIVEQAPGRFVIDGSTDLAEVSALLGLTLPASEDYDTLSGFLTDRLGRVPDEGEQPTVTLEDSPARFKVLEVKDRHIDKVEATLN